MQSLTELNNYSNTPVSYVDLRPPEIKFDRQVPTNPTTAQYETKTFSYVVVPGTEITSIAGGTASYWIDLTNNTSCSVTWPSLPSHLVVTQNANVFTVTGITTVGDWNLVKSPTITGTMGIQPFTIQSNILFDGAATSWSTAVSVISLNELSVSTADASYTSGVSSLIAHTPLIVDDVPGMDTSAYVLTITADDNSVFGSLSTTGTLGGTSVFSNNQLVISGSLAQVNSHLQSLHFTSAVDLNQVWILTYSLYNPTSEYTSLKTQYVSSNTAQFFTHPGVTYYDRNNLALVANYPQILSTVTALGTYQVTVTTNVSIFSMSSSGTGGSSSFGMSGLTILGTKDEVNSHLANIQFQAALNYNSNFIIRYTLLTPDSVLVRIPQSVFIGDANATVTFDELTTPTISTVYYVPTESSVITGGPTVNPTTTQPFVVSDYTLTITPSRTNAVSVLASSGSLGGTSTFNSTTKVLTITGTTNQINSHLAALSYTSSAVNDPFTFTYALMNSSEPFYSYEYQTVTDATAALWNNTSAITYDKNVHFTVTNNPTVITSELTSPGSLTCLVYPSDLAAITTITCPGVTSFNSTTKTLTITGTVTEVNTALNSLLIQPGLDFTGSFGLKYRVTAVNGMIGQIIQTLNLGSADTAITNIANSRSYLSNTPDQIVFPTLVPQILETVPGASYTIYFTTDSGYFGLSDSSISATYSFTGTLAQTNSALQSIKFYPLKDLIGNRTFSYQQVRNGVSQVTQTIAYVGTARTTPLEDIIHSFQWNTVYTPTYSEKAYYKATHMIVGGGGGGGWYDRSGFGVPSTIFVGGGGGGGTVWIDDVPRSVTGPITIIIGAGGAAAVPTGGNGGNSSITYTGGSTVTVSGGFGGVAQGGSTKKTFLNNLYWTGGTWGSYTGGGGGASSAANGGSGSGSTGGTGARGTLYRGIYWGGGGGGGGGDSTANYAGAVIGPKNGNNPILYGGVLPTGCGGTGQYAGASATALLKNGQYGCCIIVFSPY